jgi:proliferating cell nuclear antigen PCNA
MFQNLKVFSDKVNILFDENGVSLQMMDTARVSIFEMRIPAKWFDKYAVSAPVVLGISTTILFKILNARDKQQRICLEYESADKDSLSLYFESEKKDAKVFDKQFQVPLIDMDVETMDIPAIDYSAEFSLSSATFASLITQLKMFGETLEIQCCEDDIVLFSHSVDNGKMSVQIRNEDLTEFSIVEGEQLNLSFSLNYLHNFCTYNKIAREIAIKLAPEYPLRMDYVFGESETAPYIRYYLAPKMSDE